LGRFVDLVIWLFPALPDFGQPVTKIGQICRSGHLAISSFARFWPASDQNWAMENQISTNWDIGERGGGRKYFFAFLPKTNATGSPLNVT
jgi:hypothetical protein